MRADSLSKSALKEESESTDDYSPSDDEHECSDYDVKVKKEPEGQWNETETTVEVKQEIDLTTVKQEGGVIKKEVTHDKCDKKVRILKRTRDASEKQEGDSSRVRTNSCSGSSIDSR